MRCLQTRLLRCRDDQPVGPFWSYPLFLALSLCFLLMYSFYIVNSPGYPGHRTNDLGDCNNQTVYIFYMNAKILQLRTQSPPPTQPRLLELRNPEPHKPHHYSPTSTAWGVLAWNTGRTDVLGVWVCCWSLLCVRTLLLIDCCARSNHLHASACLRTFQYCLITHYKEGRAVKMLEP